VSLPLPTPESIAKTGHLIEDFVDIRNDISPTEFDACISRRSQSRMEYGAIFCDVDRIASKHRFDRWPKLRLIGKCKKVLERLLIDAVFRVVEVDPLGFDTKDLSSLRVFAEQIPQMHSLDLGEMDL
jgi:hypothetical protein